MLTSECSAFVKLFVKSRHEEMKQSGLGVHTVLQTLLIDKNKAFCQLGQSYSKVRDWGQDTRVIVGVMGSPITQLIQTYDLSIKIQRYAKKKKMVPCKIRLHQERQQSTVRRCCIPKWGTGYTGTMSSTNHYSEQFTIWCLHRGLIQTSSVNHSALKMVSWKKKTILKWCILSCYLKLLKYTVHATC